MEDRAVAAVISLVCCDGFFSQYLWRLVLSASEIEEVSFIGIIRDLPSKLRKKHDFINYKSAFGEYSMS